jgi:hypothetical protein
MFGSPELRVTKTNRLGQTKVRLAQIINSKWAPVTDFVDIRQE